MRINFVIVVLLLLFLSSANARTPLIEGKDATLYLEEMDNLFLTMPEGMPEKIKGDPVKLRKLMDQTYMAKVAARRAEEHKLNQSKAYLAGVENYQRNALAGSEAARYIDLHMPDEMAFEQMAKERYSVNRDKYKDDEKVAVSHILLKVNEKKDEDRVLQKLLSIKKKILTGIVSFGDAAVEYTEDAGSKESSGQLQVFTRGQMVKPFEDAAFALVKEGEISEPVRTKFGYHLIQLHKRLPAHQKSFNEVKAQLISEIQKETKSRLREDFWLQIRDDPEVKLNEKAINTFLGINNQ